MENANQIYMSLKDSTRMVCGLFIGLMLGTCFCSTLSWITLRIVATALFGEYIE